MKVLDCYLFLYVVYKKIILIVKKLHRKSLYVRKWWMRVAKLYERTCVRMVENIDIKLSIKTIACEFWNFGVTPTRYKSFLFPKIK